MIQDETNMTTQIYMHVIMMTLAQGPHNCYDKCKHINGWDDQQFLLVRKVLVTWMLGGALGKSNTSMDTIKEKRGT